jgi:hypothetical protein
MELSTQFDAVIKYLELEIKNFDKFLITVFVLFVNKIKDFLEITFEENKIAVGGAVFI